MGGKGQAKQGQLPRMRVGCNRRALHLVSWRRRTEPFFPYTHTVCSHFPSSTQHPHCFPWAQVSVLMSSTLDVPMIMTGHSLGRNKLEHLLASGAEGAWAGCGAGGWLCGCGLPVSLLASPLWPLSRLPLPPAPHSGAQAP